MNVSQSKIRSFQNTVNEFYKLNGRTLPWRDTTDPYKILVSEIMLQQTQVPRVLIKYQEFTKTFPDFISLANASVSEVLKVWQGMGYNRRGLYLKRIAEKVLSEYKGQLPKDPTALVSFPGIGQATAAAVVTYAYNIPHVFIETNIRTVFIHHFFNGKENIADKEIWFLVEKTLDHKNPRIWYSALMDYGTHLKQTKGNLSVKSKHFRKQTPFFTSNRRIRGMILKELTITHSYTLTTLARKLNLPEEKILRNLEALQKEGFLIESNNHFTLAK